MPIMCQVHYRPSVKLSLPEPMISACQILSQENICLGISVALLPPESYLTWNWGQSSQTAGPMPVEPSATLPSPLMPPKPTALPFLLTVPNHLLHSFPSPISDTLCWPLSSSFPRSLLRRLRWQSVNLSKLVQAKSEGSRFLHKAFSKSNVDSSQKSYHFDNFRANCAWNFLFYGSNV